MVVLSIPEDAPLSDSCFEHLSKLVTARQLQMREKLPFIEDSEDVHSSRNGSQSNLAAAKSDSDIIAGIRVELMEAPQFVKAVGSGKSGIYGLLVPRGDLSLKQLAKHLSKMSSFKKKQQMQMMFMGPRVSPLLDRDQPPNCKVSQRFWDFPKQQVRDEEHCLNQFISHLKCID